MKMISTSTTEWENKHETFKETIKELFIVGNEDKLDALEGYNDVTKGFQNMIADAIKNKISMRVLGAGWSWAKIATVKNGIMADTKQLNITLQLSPQSVVAGYKGDINKLLFAQCGNGVWELSKQLHAKNLSLKTTGASNGQTIVGAMSTGAHGSAIDVGAVQDYVLGIHLITSATKHIWLERKSQPVVTDIFIKNLNTELVQDDDLFNAALVSFGSFGIIHGILIETEELFLLETYMRRMPYDDTIKKLMETLDFSTATLPYGNERPYHFAVFINPYDIKNGCYVSSFYKRPYVENYVRCISNDEGIGPGDDAPCFIGKLTNVLSGIVPVLVNKLLSGAFKLFEKQMGTIGEIFNNTTLHGKLFSAAIGIPINQVSRVTELLFEINKTHGPFTGLFAYRFIKKSKATLAFTRFDFTCILELDGAFSEATQNFYSAVWKRLDDENIPYTFHWGKMNEMTPERINKMYGTAADMWVAARNKLLDADSLKVFTNPILTQWGLDTVL